MPRLVQPLFPLLSADLEAGRDCEMKCSFLLLKQKTKQKPLSSELSANLGAEHWLEPGAWAHVLA